MKELSIEEKARAYDKVRKKIAIRFGSNVADEIFSEFEMSEDERIREAIITALSSKQAEDIIEGKYKIKMIDVFAWLEDQGAHANFHNKIQIGDKVTRNEDGVLVNLSQLKRVAKKQGEQKKELFQELDKKLNNALENETTESLEKFLNEQKPTEEITSNPDYISPKDKALFEIATVLSQHEDKDGSPLEEIRSILIDYEINNLESNEQNPAWNEEDEKKRNLLINILNVNHPNEYFKVNPANTLNMEAMHTKELVDWIKSLKNRVQPQPKQEWSEEDGQYLLVCKNALAKYQTTDKWDAHIISHWLEDKLKSLKDRAQPKQEWREEDEVKDNWEYIQDFIKKLGHFPKDSDELDVLINYVLSKKQKFAWSEEDEDILNTIINHFKVDIECNDEDDTVRWLKSLKERYTWKPSDEHYELEEFAKVVRGNLTGISRAVIERLEAKYLQLTGNKMYGGFKD